MTALPTPIKELIKKIASSSRGGKAAIVFVVVYMAAIFLGLLTHAHLFLNLLTLLMALGALVVISFGALSLLLRFLFAPILALLAIPTYAALILMESYAVEFRSREPLPAFFCLSLPKNFHKKLFMNCLASITTLFGILFGDTVFNGTPYLTDKSMNLSLSTMSEKWAPLVFVFWGCLFGVLLMSHKMRDDDKHPINKLEDLVIPSWAKDWFTKTSSS